jgi:hypothetical protein
VRELDGVARDFRGFACVRVKDKRSSVGGPVPVGQHIGVVLLEMRCCSGRCRYEVAELRCCNDLLRRSESETSQKEEGQDEEMRADVVEQPRICGLLKTVHNHVCYLDVAFEDDSST